MAHGAVKYLVRVLEAAFLVILLTVGILAWRLSQGPVAINILSPYVTGALEVFNPGFQFQIEHAEFRWTGFEGQPQLVVRDVRVLDPNGSVIAGLPNLIAFLSVPALLNGDITPERINLLNPIIRFVHRADGTFSLGTENTGLAGTAETTSGNALFAGLISSLTSPPGVGESGGYLRSISIEGTTLALVDEESGRRWLTPDAALRFARNDGGVQFTATLPVSEEGRFWDVNAAGAYVEDTGNLAVDFSIENFRPARIAGLAPQLSVLEMVDLGLTGVIAANFTLEGNSARIERVDFDVEGGAGQVIQAPSGQVKYPIRSASLRGYAAESLNKIVVEDFQLVLSGEDGDTSQFGMSVIANNLNQIPSVNVEALVDTLSIEALKQYWPESFKPNTRNWVVRNLSEGTLSDMTAEIHLAGPDVERLDATHLSLSSNLNGLSVIYINGLPEVRDVGGVMQIALDEATFNITSGYVPDIAFGENLHVQGATLRMHNLGQSGTELADFDIEISSDFGAVMRLIDYQPFGYATSMGVDANAAQGEAAIKLGLKFPLVKDLKLDQLDIQVDALIEDVGIPNVAFQLPLSEGDMSVSLDRSGMDVSGSAKLGNIPLTLEWRENFDGDEIRSHYVLNPIIGNQDRPAIGLGIAPFIPPYIDGLVEARVTYTVNRDSSALMDADLDLTSPVLSIPELNWRKDSGVHAQANVSALFIDERLVEVSSFQVESEEDLKISGKAKFGLENSLESLVLEPSSIGESRLSGEIQVTAAGGYNVALVGAMLDGRSLLNEIEFGGEATEGDVANSAAESLELNAQFDHVRLASEVTFSDVEVQFQSDSGGVKLIDFVSKVDTETPFEFNLSDGPEGRVFFGGSADGGSVVRAAGLFDDIEGGLLKISGTVDESGVATGLAEIDDFKLVDAPIIARLLSVAALTGILDELRGDGISFTKLRVPFSLANSNLSIEDGEMYGSSLGLTGEGYYDFENATMNFDGTLIPAYTLNSALNSIPILGDVLNAGDKGGGIFAATYSYRGDVATVEPSVNPLAALTPGFLRRIFDIFESSDQVESLDSNDPASSNPPEHQGDLARP